MCVTMDMELGKENVDPEIQDIPKKRLKLSLAKKNRFVYKQKEEMEKICKGYLPPNTDQVSPKVFQWMAIC